MQAQDPKNFRVCMGCFSMQACAIYGACQKAQSGRLQIDAIEAEREAIRKDAARWRMHLRLMGRRHSPEQIKETVAIVDKAISESP